jgi:hypothetical protein
VSNLPGRTAGTPGGLRYQALISVGEDDGDAASITCWRTDCYEWRDARWQAVWSQATAIIAD